MAYILAYILAMLTDRLGGLIAAALYGNIGIKVIYNNVLMEIFRKYLMLL